MLKRFGFVFFNSYTKEFSKLKISNKYFLFKLNFQTSSAKYFLQVRDEKEIQNSKNTQILHESYFKRLAEKNKNKEAFHGAIQLYIDKNRVHRRGHVEFIYAALSRIEDFQLHLNLETYKKLLEIFPKYKMIPQSVWQVEFMHYPKQQQCGIDILDHMESNGVIPDDDFGYQLKKIFGLRAHVFRKYQRMMYWMPKFKYANPYFVPKQLPEDPILLAEMALKRMSVDLENEIKVFHSKDLKESTDKTFIVSAQSPEQIYLLDKICHKFSKKSLPSSPLKLISSSSPSSNNSFPSKFSSLSSNPPFSFSDSQELDTHLKIEGGHFTWLRKEKLIYFVLKSDYKASFQVHQSKVKPFDFKTPSEEKPNLYTLNSERIKKGDRKKDEDGKKTLMEFLSKHEQEEGVILAMCITGTSSKDSLVSWIKFLERTNPVLSHVPIVFQLKSQMSGLVSIDETQEK